MNERIEQLADRLWRVSPRDLDAMGLKYRKEFYEQELKKFVELIVKEICGLMEQAEDDVYHCFESSERPTEYIEWLRDWQERFTKHFGVEE